MRSKPWQVALLTLTVCAIPIDAHADVVWPALYLEQRLTSLPVIAFGLLIEIVALRLLFTMTLARALKAGVVVNVISAAFGFILIPIAGIVWELFPGQIVNRVFDVGTFNPISWTATYGIATFLTTTIELIALRWIFALRCTQRRVLIWLAANAASVALAFASLLTNPMRETPLFELWPFG